VQILFGCRAYCPPYSWWRIGLRQENKKDYMPDKQTKDG